MGEFGWEELRVARFSCPFGYGPLVEEGKRSRQGLAEPLQIGFYHDPSQIFESGLRRPPEIPGGL